MGVEILNDNEWEYICKGKSCLKSGADFSVWQLQKVRVLQRSHSLGYLSHSLETYSKP